MMYKLCKSEQSALRQREMEQQLLLMMESLRFDEITVSDLCTRAGFSRKAFYRYFSGKEGALYALIDHTLWELESFPLLGRQNAGSANKEKVVWFFRFWKNQKPLLDALEYSGINEVLIKRMLEYSMSDPGVMRFFLTCLDSQVQAYALTFAVSGIMSTVFRWHHSGFQQSPEQMAEMIWNLMTTPLVRIE